MKVADFNKPSHWPEPPFLINDSTQYIRSPLVVLERVFQGYVAVCWSFPSDGIKVLTHTVMDALIGKRYTLSPLGDVNKEIAALRDQAVESGASPEAVWLLSDYVTFDKKELSTMADKLSKKAAPKPASKPAKAEAPKKKGNPEALKKAREAKAAAGPDTRKVTVVKDKVPTYRDGSGRADAWALMAKAKTVQDYLDAGGKGKYVSRWEAEGAITLK